MKADFRKMYGTYNRYYKEMAKNSPVAMADKMSRVEFRTYYTALKNTRQEQVRNGERKTTGAIIRDMVIGQQQFSASIEQARKMNQAAKQFDFEGGKKYSYKDFRTNPEAGKALSKKLKEYREYLIKNGMKKSDAYLHISDNFFGSNPLK